MKDRVSTYPGRVKLTPVAGQTNVYDLTRADEATVAGTPLNKATLLTDETAAMYGQTSNPVPDDIFAALGRYKMHWWQTQGASWQEKQGDVDYEGTNAYLAGGPDGNTTSNTIYYSDEINIDQLTGEVSLVSPTALTVSYNRIDIYDVTTAISGKYVTGFLTGISWDSFGTKDPNIYLVKSGLGMDDIVREWYRGGDDSDVYGLYTVYLYSSNLTATITSEFKADPNALGGYVQSLDENAYPHGGFEGGVEYTYIGVPLERLPGAPRIAVGEYAGTGAKSVTITVDFKPLFLLSFRQDIFWSYAVLAAYPWDEIAINTGGHSGIDTVTWGENSVTISSTGGYAPNDSGYTYSYFCAGI